LHAPFCLEISTLLSLYLLAPAHHASSRLPDGDFHHRPNFAHPRLAILVVMLWYDLSVATTFPHAERMGKQDQ
jgi:hypothetical protein